MLEERAKDVPDEETGRALMFRAASVLTSKASEHPRASDAWGRFSQRFGADREALAAWIPLLEAHQDWTRLALALEGEASVAPPEERPRVLLRLGQIRLQRTHDTLGAIEAFAHALAADPAEATSRASLERLAASGPERLAAARALEPYYRAEQSVSGLLRVLDLKARESTSIDDRMAAIEEALTFTEKEGQPGAASDWMMIISTWYRPVAAAAASIGWGKSARARPRLAARA